MAGDLFHPTYKIGRLQALRARLVRNYWAVYAAVLIAWIVKIALIPNVEGHALTLRERLSDGLLPWWVAALYVSIFLAGLGVLMLLPGRVVESEVDYWLPSPYGKEESIPMDL